MGNIGLVSMLSAFATISLIVAFIIGITIFIIGTLFEKKIKENKHNSKIIVMLTKFVTFLTISATILEIITVYIK
nr:MAG TPA: hypothetical protein [Caudoviricetes sp.]